MVKTFIQSFPFWCTTGVDRFESFQTMKEDDIFEISTLDISNVSGIDLVGRKSIRYSNNPNLDISVGVQKGP